ncbi:capsular polysaccharide synthesis protein [Lactobacillus sp. PV034]|uniref:capsular polysaccharide synthesis protein n=1 Tax=Lactobacillus sp. PV034 TaxID=2594495 RepID=UPI00223FDE56|nr:capsular polysaccharide synthesis protein [Lactobacillus sp. PV034]QNQ80527.1 hypothetical protein FP432_02650 [Lactobacillus sp. PV034]
MKKITYINEFGLKIFLSKSIRRLFFKNYTWIGKKINLKNENIIKKFLIENIWNEAYKISLQPNPINKSIEINNTIWTMWWQGEKNAPDIVKVCIKKLRDENKKVVVITKDNYLKYVTLEKEIVKKFKEEKISFTHFSDIIRVNLLFNYGGMWIDSTVLATKKIQNSILKKEFYSIKTENYTNDPSHGRWTTFCMEAIQGSIIMKYLVNAFNIYFKKYNYMVDYILLDYFILLAYESNNQVRLIIDNIPKNNSHVFDLRKYLNIPVKKCKYFKDTYLYKLSYKMNFNVNSKQQTLYQNLILNIGNNTTNVKI